MFRRHEAEQVVEDGESSEDSHRDQRRAGVGDDPDLDVAQEGQADHEDGEQEDLDEERDRSRQPRRTIEVIVLRGLNNAEGRLGVHRVISVLRHGFLPPW